MAPRVSIVLTGAATFVVVAAAGYATAIQEWDIAAASVACGFAVAVGWVVVRHDSTSPVGPALAWTTASIALVSAHVGPLADLPWSSGAWPVNLAGLFALMLVFPAGPSQKRLWRAVPWAFVMATAGMIAAQWGATQVDGEVVGGPTASWLGLVALASLITIALCLLLAAASLAIRYRSGSRRIRRQIRWLLLAGLAVVVLLIGGWIAEAMGYPIDVAYTPFLVAIIVLVPAAIGVAVVRYDLFDVDRLLSASTAWLVTVVLSASIFGVVVYAASHAVELGTGATSAMAAFVIALVLLPVQRRIAGWVGRLVDRDRHLAVAQVERFAADVRAGRRQPEEIEAVLRDVQDDPDLVVQVGRPDGTWTGLDGTPVGASQGFAIEAGGDVIARIELGWDSLRARRRLADIAHAAWVPIEVSRLRLGLRGALTEAEASRGRLVEVTVQERLRLERDLHDGAQQRIVATGMRLRLLQEQLPPREAHEIDLAVQELQETVYELRRIAQGVRPSQLDDGLAAALVTIKATTPIPLSLEVAELPEVNDTRALNAYLVVSEAVANVLKHAGASQVSVRVSAVRDRICVEVADDGIGGLPEDAPLPALRDRVLSVGGSLRIHSPAGTGTTILAVI